MTAHAPIPSQDLQILEIAAKLRFEIDPEMELRYYPRQFASSVRLGLADGTTRSAMVVDSVGTARKPMSKEQIIAKGAGLAAAGSFPSGEELAAAIWDDGQDAIALARLLNRH